MKQLEQFIGRAIDAAAARDHEALAGLGVESRHVPEEFEDFEELEFGLGSIDRRTTIFTAVLERGKLSRVSLGYVPPGGDEDDMQAFTPAELEDVLALKAETLERFFARVFPG